MASIVLRKDGRAEIRESYTTPRGPRSRTLAVFRELTERDLEKAERRASRPFSRSKILARARALGVPRFGESAARAARTLLAELGSGRPLAPTLVAALRDALDPRPGTPLPESVGALLPWLPASDEERGEALREQLYPDRRHPLAKDTPADEKVALLAKHLERAGIPHAFGGPLALAYYTVPELPYSVELWVFEPASRTGRALAALEKAGVAHDRRGTMQRLQSTGEASLEWGLVPIRVHCTADAFHDACRARVREVPFGEQTLRILSAEDLIVLATLRGRVGNQGVLPPTELERLLFARIGDLDLEYVRDWLDRILGPGEETRVRFEEVARRMLGDDYLFYGTTLTCRVETEGSAVVRQVLALLGAVELPDPGTPAHEQLARGIPEGPALVKKAPVRDDVGRLSGLQAGTYTVVATGYELTDPRRRVMKSRVVELPEGLDETEICFRF